MAGINVIRRWVMSQMTKTADDGIMITLPDSKKVDLNVSITMDRLIRNGIDPNQITNPQQVDNAINMINSRMASRAIPADSAEGREITEKIFGKQKAPVFDMEGNRIPEGSGIMGGKSVKELMESGQVSKGARGMKKSKKVQDREMFKAANERLTSDVDTIVKNIKSMEPITAMKEANSVIARKGKYKNLTSEQSKKILQDTEDHIFERDIPEEDFAKGGRAGFAGGSDMGTVADSKGNVGPSKGGYQGSGDGKGGKAGGPGDGPDDRGNERQNAVQALVRAGFTPREINRITNPSTLDKIRNSRFNNPITRGVLRAGLYALNPAIGGLEFRKAAQLKNFYDVIKSELDAPVEEEDLTLGGIGGENMADGGRAGFMAGGMSRRAFLKLMGGTGATIGAAKSGIFSGFGKGAGKEVAKEVVQQSATTPPPYFFKLAEKIKMLGDDATATTDRTIAKTLKSKDGKSTYVLEEDVTTGDTIIKKVNKEGDEMITDVEIMEFRKGEVVQGKDGKAMKTPDQYEEVTEANARIEGDVFNDPYYTDGIQVDEIMKEVGEQAPSIKKAGGGIARMLGE